MAGISEALKASGCTAADEQIAAKQFIAEDIQDPGDLGEDPDKVPGRIDDILKKTTLDPAARDKIKTAMVAAWHKEKDAPSPPPPPPSPKVPSSTSIEAVLKDVRGCTDDDRKKVLAEFDKEGIIELIDLGKDPQLATTKIDYVLGKTGLPKDKTDLFKSALTAARAKDPGAPSPATPTPAESTTVPPGGVNVLSTTFPTLKAEGVGTIATFTIPTIFTSSPDPLHPYQSPADLKPWQWIHLAKTNNLTKALNLSLVLSGSSDPLPSYSAFLWELQDGAVDDVSKGSADSTVTATIEQDRAAANMATSGSLDVQYVLCSASVKGSYATQATSENYSKIIHTRARFVQWRCALHLEICLRVAPIFQHLIDVALDPKEIKPDDQFEFLTQLLEIFGHVFPRMVYLGGMAEICQDLVSVENQTSGTTKTSLDGAVTAKVDNLPVSGKAQVGFATDGSGAKDQGTCIQQFNFTTYGGEPTANPPPKNWTPTTNTPELWKTIGREDWLPTVQKLSSKDLDAINKVVARTVREAWTDDAVVALAKDDRGDFSLPLDLDNLASSQLPILPYFPKGHSVTLKNWWSSTNNVNPYLLSQNGVDAKPDQGAGNENGAGVSGQSLPPGDPCRVQGSYYAHCQPAPLCAPDAAGGSPEEEHLLWKFVYTGRKIRVDDSAVYEPEFWIVSDDEQWVLSVFWVPGELAFACLFPYAEEKKLRTVPSPGKWLLRPAGPPGRLQLPSGFDDRSGYFRLFNPYHPGYLADYLTCPSKRKWVETVPGHFVRSPGSLTGIWVPDQQITHEESGPDFQRTALRYPAPTGGAFDPVSGQPNTTQEANNDTLYMQQCWLIEDRSEPAPKRTFSQLEPDYIEQWIAKHEASLQPVPVAPDGGR